MIIRLYFILSLFSFTGLYAQHHHYLYIQSEPPQAFYLKLGLEVLNSNAGGFLILPKLRDSSFTFTVGFPGNLFPPYRFAITSMKKDKGYSLKNFGEKGWGLFDLQTLEILMGEKTGTEIVKQEYFQPPLTQDAFTTILAAVIDDPGLTRTQLVGKEDLMVASIVPAVQKTSDPKQQEALTKSQRKNSPPDAGDKKTANDSDKSIALSGSSTVKEEKKLSVPPKAPEKKPVAGNKKEIKKVKPEAVAVVRKISQEIVADGLLIVYSDPSISGKNDTVNILIPPYKEPEPVVQRESIAEKIETVPDSVVKIPAPVVLMPEKTSQETKINDRVEVVSVGQPPVANTRQDCRKVATDKDVAALKRRILTIREESDMVSAALKEFRQKCYNTDQVKTISFIFLTDDGKYKLMDAAYPYIYDPAAFSGLESLLNDSYYINRFKALLR